jgi:hypothetical protein
MMNNKSCYLSKFFKSSSLVCSLLIAALACTLIVFGHIGGLWSLILGTPDYLRYTLCVIALYAIILCIYITKSASKSKIGITDALSFAILLVGIFYLCLTAFYFRAFDKSKLLLSVASIAIGLALFFNNMFKFGTDNQEQAIKTENIIGNYYKAVVNKYPFFGIIYASVIITFACTLFFCPFHTFAFSDKEFVLLTVLALPIIFFVGKSASSKQVNIIDALLISLAMSAPLVLILILLCATNQERNLAIWAIALMAGILLTFLRYRNFDLSYQQEEKEVSCKCLLGGYFKKIANKYDGLLVLSVASLLSASLFIVFPMADMYNFIKVTEVLIIDIRLLLMLAIEGTVLATLLLGVLLPISGIAKKSISLADFLLAVFAIFTVFSALDLIIAYNLEKLIILLAGFAFSIVMAYQRAREVK